MATAEGGWVVMPETGWSETLDRQRTTLQRSALAKLMGDGVWRTREQMRLSLALPPDADILRRLRELRAERYGGHDIEKRRAPVDRHHPHSGVWQYRIRPDFRLVG